MRNEQAPNPGKAMKDAAEKAYDEIAQEHGIDEHGDELPVEDEIVEDDEPVLQDDENEETDEPVAEVEETDGEPGEDDPPGETEDPAPSAAEAAGEASKIEAPHTWKQEWKDDFNKIDSPEVRKAVLELSGHMNRAFTQRMMEVSNIRKDFEGVEKALTPHAERLQRAGIAPDVAVARALGWDAHIQNNPVQGWLDYGKALGIDPQEAINSQVDDTRFLTPTERRIMEQNTGLEKRLQASEGQMAQFINSQREAAQRSRQAEAEQVLTEFMNAKDGAGNLLHPHVEMVAGVMTRLIDGNVANDLDQAYKMASAAHPQIQQALERTRRTAQVKESQKKVAKVRKASKSGIVAKGGGKQPKPGKSFEQRVSENYDKIANG